MRKINKENKKNIYLDNASATPLSKEVFLAMSLSFKEDFSNPNTIHEKGIEVKNKIVENRKNIAQLIGANKDEIIFTSGATEANNLAILGLVNNLIKTHKKPHIITTKIEHASVLEVFKFLEKNKNIEVTYLNVLESGLINLKEFKKSLKDNTVLISIIYANNEIGTIEPIKEIGKIVRHFRKNKKNHLPYLHTDATQAVNYLDVNVQRLGVDLLSFNAAKMYGPKGIGVLFKKRSIRLDPVILGGDQEEGLRGGTLNAPLILGFNEALKLTLKIQESETKRLTKLRDYFLNKLTVILKKHEINFKLNGSLLYRLPNNLNITIPIIPSDLLLVELSMRGIYVSEKSACKTGDKKNSHVLEAITKDKENIINSLRFSLGRETKKADLDYVIKSFDHILKKLKVWYK